MSTEKLHITTELVYYSLCSTRTTVFQNQPILLLLRLEPVAAAADPESAVWRLADAERLLHGLGQPQPRRLREQDRQQARQYPNHSEDDLFDAIC